MGINYKTNPSLYEGLYIIWNGIDFDKDKLIKFVKRLKWVKFWSFIPRFKEEYQMMKTILQSCNYDRINGLLNNDENTIRICLIEKYARIGALDIAIHGVYTRDTYRVISNLPKEDYKLVLKRVEELVKIAQTTTIQSDNISDNIPGT
jgi:hypothetical protein